MAASDFDSSPKCDCRLAGCKICNPDPAPDYTGYIADIQYLISLIPEWAKTVPKGLDPTFYATLSYGGDMEVKRRVDEILKKYT